MRGSSTIYYLLSIILTSCLLYACNKDLPLPDVEGKKKITLLGEFIAGEKLCLRAGQSVPLVKNAVLHFEVPQGMAIMLKDSAGNAYTMRGIEDSFSQTLYTIPYNLDNKATHGNVYTVAATVPALATATATIRIPGPIDAKVKDTLTTTYASKSALRIRVQLNDPGNSTNYYVIEAVKQHMDVQGHFFHNNTWYYINNERYLYEQLKAAGPVQTHFDTTYEQIFTRQSVYTADGNTENVADVGEQTKSKRVLLKDTRFNGLVYETDVYIAYDQPGYLQNYTNGQVIVYIKSVSEDYFKFLKSYETYDPTGGYNSIEQPVKIQGNVLNGFGMIGGVSQTKYIYLKDTWNF